MSETLFEKVWNAHAVRTLPSGQTQLFVGLHLIHEVTTPQAFDMLRQHGWSPSRCIPHGGHQMSLNIAAGLGLGGNESYPDLFQPFVSFPLS